MLDTYCRKYFDGAINGGAKLFLKLRLHPTQVTAGAAVIGVGAAFAYGIGLPLVSVALLWLSGGLDAVDGAMARQSNQVSPVGTLLDIFFDRVVELAFIIAFALRHREALFSLLILTCAIVLSMTVFLTSGNLLVNTGVKSFRYQAGLMERTEGFLMFTLMIAIAPYMRITALVYAFLIYFTAGQRLITAVYELKESSRKGEERN